MEAIKHYMHIILPIGLHWFNVVLHIVLHVYVAVWEYTWYTKSNLDIRSHYRTLPFVLIYIIDKSVYKS